MHANHFGPEIRHLAQDGAALVPQWTTLSIEFGINLKDLFCRKLWKNISCDVTITKSSKFDDMTR
jgi:hypothetical protein